MSLARRSTAAPVGALALTLTLVGCGSSAPSRPANSGSTSSTRVPAPTTRASSRALTTTATPAGPRITTRATTCRVEVGALVDNDIYQARTGGDGTTQSLAIVIGVRNPVLLAGEAVSNEVFQQRSSAGAVAAVARQCATRHDPVLSARDLTTVENNVPPADVAVLKRVTVTH